MTTNVPPPILGPNGFIAPDEADILKGVLKDFNQAFGGGMSKKLDTPQGQLASSITAIIGEANDTFVFITNMVDPSYSEGRMQDAIGRIYFLTRNPSQPTTVDVLCTGRAGVTIPSGALVVDTSNNIYTCVDGADIPIGGSITLSFANITPGPIACLPHTITRIYQAISGWDSVDNVADGVLGNDVEGREAFELRRAASVAQNTLGGLPAVLGSVLSVPNVLDAYVVDNPLGTTAVIGGYTLAAHSLYVAAVGGSGLAIAEAIWRKKAPGCDYNGNTTFTVTDQTPPYTPPYPSYTVKFERPGDLSILFAISLANNPLVPSNAPDLINAALQNAFAGNDGGPRARIGSTIYATRFMAPLAALGPWVQIISLLVGSNNTHDAVFTATIDDGTGTGPPAPIGNVLTVTAVSSGTLAVGQVISDVTGLLPEGSMITALGTGSGSTGTYILDKSSSVASEVMKAKKPDDNSVVVQIDQVPVFSPNNVKLTLV
jgi:hypothetical protein